MKSKITLLVIYACLMTSLVLYFVVKEIVKAVYKKKINQWEIDVQDPLPGIVDDEEELTYGSD